MGNGLSPEWVNTAGVWVGFMFTLLIFSALFGDHLLARFAQYVLVGAGLGYAAVVTWQSMLALEFVAALRANPQAASWEWTPLVLAAILAIAGLERIFAQGRPQPTARRWQRALRTLGAVPALALVALGVAVAAVGAMQGTLAPQFLYTARSSLQWGSELTVFISGALTLLLTTAALTFFVLDADQHLRHQPGWVQRLGRGWVWIGQRAVWLAAGALFARLFAARLTLFIAELTRWLAQFQAADIGATLAEWWRMITGA
ncbi:MAG TPA: hypothetical protein DCL15_20670 [Chloroflexi bacterium]|nr:hypothetical protein [Chloroflexota bacterium]HHW85547.1 hypothetical protein [Chloroflexota bacterium]